MTNPTQVDGGNQASGISDAAARQTETHDTCLNNRQRLSLADGLLAIGAAIAAEPAAEVHSLNQWLTWLNEESYDPDGLIEALTSLGQQRLEPSAWQQLQAEADAAADTPNGITAAVQHLEQLHPELLEEILAIEQARSQELETLHATAGGMSKSTLGFTIAGSIVAACGIGAFFYVRKLDKETEAIRTEIMESKAAKEAQWTHQAIMEIDAEKSQDNLVKATAMRLKKPLIDMTPADIRQVAEINSKAVFKLSHVTESDALSAVNARLMRWQAPNRYLMGFNDWLKSSEVTEAGKIYRDATNIRADLQDARAAWKDIKNIDRDLLKEFEKSAAAKLTLAEVYGVGRIFRDSGMQKVSDLWDDVAEMKLKEIKLDLENKIKNNVNLNEAEKYLNEHLEVDWTPESIEKFFNDNYEAAFRMAIKNYGTDIVFDDALKAHPNFTNSTIISKLSPKINIYNQKIKALATKEEDSLKNEQIKLEEIDNYKKANADLVNRNVDLENLIYEYNRQVVMPLYLADRDALIAQKAAAENEIAFAEEYAKNTGRNAQQKIYKAQIKIEAFRKKLEDLEDFNSWFETKVDLGKNFDDFFNQEVNKETKAARKMKQEFDAFLKKTEDDAYDSADKIYTDLKSEAGRAVRNTEDEAYDLVDL